MHTTGTTNLLDQATTLYQAQGSLASAYLEVRGITPAIAVAARLGVCAKPVPGHEAMEGRLTIPYLTKAGVVNLKFRCIEQHNCKDAGHQKYLGLHGHAGKPRLYNVNAFFDQTPLIAISEGELDALVLSHHADIPSVGCPGVSTWQPHFPRCFAGYDTVLVFADGDKPGRDMARMLVKELPNARPVYLPDDTDVTDIYLAEGGEGLRMRAGL